MAIDWEDYLPEVLPDVPGCPDRVAIDAILQSAIEFCNQARTWRQQLTDLVTAQSTATYDIEVEGLLPADSEPLAIHKLQHNDFSRPLATISKQQLDIYRLTDTEEKPYYFNNDEPKVVRLYPTPDAAYTMFIWAILKPTKASTSGPDFLYNDWLEPIAHGAKARLCAQAARPWGNKSMVRFHRSEFIGGYVEARIRDTKSNVQSSTVPYPSRRFGVYRNRNWW